MPLITIVTITYNAENFLDRTLKSFQNALKALGDPSMIEYLIIDGNSKDSTLQIADRYRHFVTKILSEPDRGLYDAMNKGISLATGRYLWFLNAGDEVYDQNTLSNLVSRLKSGADIYYSDAMLVKENGDEVGLRSQFTPHILPANLKWQDFSLGMKVCHQAFIPKKEIAPGYDISNLSADIDWEIECLKKSGNTEFLDFILCRYLLGGTSTQNHRRSLTDRFHVLRKHFGFFPTLFNHLLILYRGFLFARRNGKYW
jgi:glycosyltransferase involved in cell wall biosynthesis